MSELQADLRSLPLHEILSAPLNAAIEAQQQSSLALVGFVREVGFVEVADGRGAAVPRTVEFRYARDGIDVDGNAVTLNTRLEIPLLAMISIPHLVIDTLDVNVLVGLQSVSTTEASPLLGISKGLQDRYPFLRSYSSLRVAPTPRAQTKGTTRTTRSYDLEITMRASSEEPTDGIQRLLTAMTSLMSERSG